ncbi:MAG: DUF1800 family protein, partial [Saprospiraceae bacterium]
MINQPLSIVEKMTAFLSTYLVTEADVVGDGRFIYKTNALIRSHALGNFKELVKKISIDPGMLIYLNGYLNSSGKPDENYSRELQELFTQGKGEDSKYTEDDVKAAARLLTGYTFDSVNISYKFNPNKHDTGDKQFSSYYNNTLITGKTGAAGEQELDELIDMLFNTEEAAKFFVRRLYNYFVYYDISQAEEDNIITPLADLFRSSNYEIKPVLEALLNSEHFYDTLNVGCVIKSGYDLVIGALRQFEVGFSPSSNYVAQYSQWSQMRIQLIILQHDPGAPPNVAGYPAYYQAPQFHEIWINSVTLPARQSWTARMLSNGYTVSGFKVIIDPIAYAMTLDNPGDPNTLVAESVFLLFGLPVSTDALDF